MGVLGGPMRVLIVEDEFLLRDDLAQTLRAAGYEVSEASNGRTGLEAMRRDKPQLVLLDLFMPVMDGAQFRAQQLRDPALAAVPVVIVSGHADERQVRSLGAADFVGKPVDERALMVIIERIRSSMPDA